MHLNLRRSLATAAALTVATGAVSCSNGEDAAADSAEASTETTTEAVDDIDVAVESMVGLEVTAVGNVSDVLSDEALRIDRDGLGTTEDKGEVDDAADWDYDYDYDYYDHDDLTEYDEEFGDDDLDDEGVLVISATGLKNHEVDEAVRVSGTVRRFDQDILESVYDLNLAGDVFDGYEDTLVIVADSVRPASASPASKANGGGGTAPSDSAS
jgi:hypothetical protein